MQKNNLAELNLSAEVAACLNRQGGGGGGDRTDSHSRRQRTVAQQQQQQQPGTAKRSQSEGVHADSGEPEREQQQRQPPNNNSSARASSSAPNNSANVFNGMSSNATTVTTMNENSEHHLSGETTTPSSRTGNNSGSSNQQSPPIGSVSTFFQSVKRRLSTTKKPQQQQQVANVTPYEMYSTDLTILISDEEFSRVDIEDAEQAQRDRQFSNFTQNIKVLEAETVWQGNVELNEVQYRNIFYFLFRQMRVRVRSQFFQLFPYGVQNTLLSMMDVVAIVLCQQLVDMAVTDTDIHSMAFPIIPGQRISLENCPPTKRYLYFSFMAFKMTAAVFKPDLDGFRRMVVAHFHGELPELPSIMYGAATGIFDGGDSASEGAATPVNNNFSQQQQQQQPQQQQGDSGSNPLAGAAATAGASSTPGEASDHGMPNFMQQAAASGSCNSNIFSSTGSSDAAATLATLRQQHSAIPILQLPQYASTSSVASTENLGDPDPAATNSTHTFISETNTTAPPSAATLTTAHDESEQQKQQQQGEEKTREHHHHTHHHHHQHSIELSPFNIIKVDDGDNTNPTTPNGSPTLPLTAQAAASSSVSTQQQQTQPPLQQETQQKQHPNLASAPPKLHASGITQQQQPQQQQQSPQVPSAAMFEGPAQQHQQGHPNSAAAAASFDLPLHALLGAATPIMSNLIFCSNIPRFYQYVVELEHEYGLAYDTAEDNSLLPSAATTNQTTASASSPGPESAGGDGASPFVMARQSSDHHGFDQSHYVREELIGEGAFGMVYRCLDITNGKMYAMKRIRLSKKAKSVELQIRAEFNMLKALSHENIIKYNGYAFDRDEGCAVILMEYAQKSLRAIVSDCQKLPERLIAHYCRKILSGLKYLHQNHIVHRDIKCANILVTEQGSVKVSDFGTAFLRQFSSSGTTQLPQVSSNVAGGIAALGGGGGDNPFDPTDSLHSIHSATQTMEPVPLSTNQPQQQQQPTFSDPSLTKQQSSSSGTTNNTGRQGTNVTSVSTSVSSGPASSSAAIVAGGGITLQGTPLFLAPELIQGVVASEASDIWSFGCCLIEMATGSYPYQEIFANPAHTPFESIIYHIGTTSAAPKLADGEKRSAEFQAFVSRCLQIDPCLRPTAGQLETDPFLVSLFPSEQSQPVAGELGSATLTLGGKDGPGSGPTSHRGSMRGLASPFAMSAAHQHQQQQQQHPQHSQHMQLPHPRTGSMNSARGVRSSNAFGSAAALVGSFSSSVENSSGSASGAAPFVLPRAHTDIPASFQLAGGGGGFSSDDSSQSQLHPSQLHVHKHVDAASTIDSNT